MSNATFTADEATATVTALSAAVAGSAKAAESYAAKHYSGADVAAVKLALSAARQLAGLAKPAQGGAGQRVNDTVREFRAINATDASHVLSDTELVKCARLVLDIHRAKVAADRAAAKAAKQADSDTRAAAKAVLNDRGAAKSDRIAALEVMAEIDGKGDRAKSESAYDRFVKAVESFAAAGFSAEQAAGIIAGVFETVAELVAA